MNATIERKLTLPDAIRQEMQRCRELIATYDEVGPVGNFARVAIGEAVRQAEAAVASGDVVAMIDSLRTMQRCE